MQRPWANAREELYVRYSTLYVLLIVFASVRTIWTYFMLFRLKGMFQPDVLLIWEWANFHEEHEQVYAEKTKQRNSFTRSVFPAEGGVSRIEASGRNRCWMSSQNMANPSSFSLFNCHLTSFFLKVPVKDYIWLQLCFCGLSSYCNFK